MSFGKVEHIPPFHFCDDIDDYTGISAASYKEFLKSVKQVKVKSLGFHLQRGDFQKWVLDVFGDEKLAKEMEKVRKQKLRGRALRDRLYRIVSKRHKELTSKSH